VVPVAGFFDKRLKPLFNCSQEAVDVFDSCAHLLFQAAWFLKALNLFLDSFPGDRIASHVPYVLPAVQTESQLVHDAIAAMFKADKPLGG
jgi:hypothetical protein